MIIIQLLLFCIVLLSSTGLVNSAPLFQLSSPIGDFSAKDVFMIILLVVIIPDYFKQRKILRRTRWFSFIEFSWIIVILFLAVESYRSPASNLSARLNNVRFVQSFLLFFPTLSLISSSKRYKILEAIGITFAIAGTFLVIAQSLRGFSPLTDSPYYDTGPWLGGISIVGNLTRVYLAITDWIAFIAIVLIARLLIRFNFSHLLIDSFLLVAILISFSRSMWLGMLGGVILIIYMYYLFGILLRTRIFKLIAIPVVVGISLLLSPLFGFENLTGALVFRVSEGITFFSDVSGTWASRMVAQDAGMRVWEKNQMWGIGTNYLSTVGMYIDLGIPLTLVTIGIIGLILITAFFVSLLILGWHTAREGVRRRSSTMIVIGASLSAEIVLAIVFQQFLAPRIFGIIAIWSALAVTCLAKVPPFIKPERVGTKG